MQRQKKGNKTKILPHASNPLATPSLSNDLVWYCIGKNEALSFELPQFPNFVTSYFAFSLILPPFCIHKGRPFPFSFYEHFSLCF